jgi:hypothetical protein
VVDIIAAVVDTISGPASWRRPFSRQGGAFPFVLRASFILRTPSFSPKRMNFAGSAGR